MAEFALISRAVTRNTEFRSVAVVSPSDWTSLEITLGLPDMSHPAAYFEIWLEYSLDGGSTWKGAGGMGRTSGDYIDEDTGLPVNTVTLTYSGPTIPAGAQLRFALVCGSRNLTFGSGTFRVN